MESLRAQLEESEKDFEFARQQYQRVAQKGGTYFRNTFLLNLDFDDQDV